MKKTLLIAMILAFIGTDIIAQVTTRNAAGYTKRKAAVENSLKTYFKAINSNDQAKWESMIDVTTLGWGTRDSLPWLKDPNMPSVVSPRDPASGLPSGSKLEIAVEPTTWIHDSMFLDLRQNSFTFDDIESMTIRRGFSLGTIDSLPWIKAFIVLKPGNKVTARVAGDEFRGVKLSDLKHKKANRFIAPDLLGMLRGNPKAINRVLSLRMQKRSGGLVIVHSDNPVVILAPPPEKKGPGK